MPDAKATRLLQTAERMWSDRGVADTLAQEIAQYVLPHKSTIILTRAKGARQTIDLFESTAIWAAQMLAANISAGTTPSSSEWFSLKYRQEELNADKETADWLEECGGRMFLALNQSNFHQEALEAMVDLVVFGTGCVFEDAKPPTRQGGFGGLRFRGMGFGTYAIEEDEDGDVDRLYRKFTLTAWAARELWKDKAGKEANRLAETKPEQRITILHAVYPNRTRNPKLADSANMPWSSCYLIEKEGLIADEGGFQEFPNLVPRWNKVTDEVYGRGPSHTALPAIRSLNAAKEILLKAAPLQMQPPTVEIYGQVLGELDLTPGGRNTEEQANSLRFLDTKGRVDIGNLVLGDLRTEILDIYYIPQLKLKESPQMTATEVLALREQLERLMGPTIGRIESEFLNPLIQRTFGLMQRGGAFSDVPEAVTAMMQQGGTPELDIQYEGPLQRSRRSADIVAIQRVYQQALALQPVAPEIMDNFDHDEAIRIDAEISGAPSKILRSREQVAQMRADRAAQQQQQAQMAQVSQIAEAAGKAAPAIDALGRIQTVGQGTTNGRP